MAVKTYSLKTDGNQYLSKNFQVKEFRCQDGSDKILIDEDLVKGLQRIRDHFGKPLTITSAYRNARHNANVGGASNSQHLYGTAADIVVCGITPTLVAQYAQFIGMRGIGDYDRSSGYFTHTDMRAGCKVFWRQINKKYTSVSSHGGQEQFDNKEINKSRQYVQEITGFDDLTMKFLDGYKHAAALFDKLAACLLNTQK